MYHTEKYDTYIYIFFLYKHFGTFFGVFGPIGFGRWIIICVIRRTRLCGMVVVGWTRSQSLFEPYMKSFFVRSSDPTQIKLLKLEILTNIANETNIPLREFQTYISSQDKLFVAATITSIGRCASNIKQVAESCLNGLVSLLSHRDRKFYFVTFPFFCCSPLVEL